jgi:phenylacetate-CoA ligase
MSIAMPFFDAEIETLPRAAIEALQWTSLKPLLDLAYERGALVRTKWDAAGVRPKDINSLSDFTRLVPFITKDDVRNYREETGDPFGGLLLPDTSELRSITASSGTTGDPTFFARRDLYSVVGRSAVDRGFWDLGLRPGEFGISTNPTFRGSNFLLLQHFGLKMISVDHTPDEIPRLIELSRTYRPTLLISLSTPLLLGLEKFEAETGMDLAEIFGPYKAVIWGGEPLSPRARTLTDRWKMNIFDVVSLGDISVTLEAANRTGAYAWEDEALIEHLDPQTLEPAIDGSLGELVVTSLQNTVDPLIRFRSDDLVWLTREICPSGRTHARFKIEGRAGDQVVVAGKPVLPVTVWPCIESQPESKAGLFQIVRPPLPESVLRLRVGYSDGADLSSLERRLKGEIHRQLGLVASLDLVPNEDLLKLGPPHKIPRVTKL